VASNILAPNGPTSNMIVDDLIVMDLISDVDADLEFRPRAFSRVFDVLRPAVNAVAIACRDPNMLDKAIADQRVRAIAGGRKCEIAFDRFVENMRSAA
jgi:hypothetical protein